MATYEWSAVMERLSYHRERLGLGKAEVAKIIKEHYGRGFWHLADAEVVELGQHLSLCNSLDDLMQRLPKQSEQLIEDTDIFKSI